MILYKIRFLSIAALLQVSMWNKHLNAAVVLNLMKKEEVYTLSQFEILNLDHISQQIF